jgi:capsule polysaccharide modification protein KpsS
MVMRAPGLGLALAPPARPVQVEPLPRDRADQHLEESPHLRRREWDQRVSPPFLAVASFAVARVTSRYAWASKQSVI